MKNSFKHFIKHLECKLNINPKKTQINPKKFIKKNSKNIYISAI